MEVLGLFDAKKIGYSFSYLIFRKFCSKIYTKTILKQFGHLF